LRVSRPDITAREDAGHTRFKEIWIFGIYLVVIVFRSEIGELM
jgi:hypothetical protein